MLKWRLRGSSSRSPKEALKPKYNLPRAAKVRPCEWSCNKFLRDAGIFNDFYHLANNAGIIPFPEDKLTSTSSSQILLCKTFISILGDIHLLLHSTYMMFLER